MSIVPQFYINSVASIGVRNSSSISWIGTGFFSYRKIDEDGGAIPFLVTNKHVIDGKDSIVFRIRKSNHDSFETVDALLVKAGRKIYLTHPQEDIDIAVIPLNADYYTDRGLTFEGFDIDEHAMTSSELLDEGADEGSLVHMLGFPMGLVNETSTLPICRLGCIARISAAQIAESHNILIDMQNFPGNSGSPIVTRPEITSIQGTKSLNKSILLGIVHAYIPYQENLINSQTKQIVELRSENSGIALVHPVEFIRDVVDMFVKLPEKSEAASALH